MDGYISILFLISVALTFHGTEAQCRGLCIAICQHPENNCCAGNAGASSPHIPGLPYVDGTYDYACKNGRCYIGCTYLRF